MSEQIPDGVDDRHTMLLMSPAWGGVASTSKSTQTQISFVECPRFMALCGGQGREGSVKAAAGAASAVGVKRRAFTGSFRLCQNAA